MPVHSLLPFLLGFERSSAVMAHFLKASGRRRRRRRRSAAGALQGSRLARSVRASSPCCRCCWLLSRVGARDALDVRSCCAGRKKGHKPPYQLNTWQPARLVQRLLACQSEKFNHYHTSFPSYPLPLSSSHAQSPHDSFLRSAWKSPLSSNEKQSNN